MMKDHESVTAESWQVDINETDESKFDIMTDSDIWSIVDLIKAARGDARILQKTKDELEKAHGVNHVPNGMTTCRRVSPCSMPE